MSASNRAAKLQKVHKALKKLYTPVKPPSDRTILEHMIYACCLENAGYQVADEALARLQETYLDWNEVRVTTVAELSECLACLKDPEAAARRVKNSLHSVFETYYSWDIEFLKKENLGAAVKKMESYRSMSPFVISYVSQNGLGGHSIPIDDAALVILYAVEVIDEAELRAKQVPGLERAISKSKGSEFGSLLHQLAAELHASPYSPEKRAKVIGIEASAKDRLPKRPSAKKKAAKAKARAAVAKGVKGAGSAKTKPAEKSAAKTTKATAKPAKKSVAKKSVAKKSATKTTAAKSKTVAEKKKATKTRKTSKSASKSAGSKTKKKAGSARARKKPR